VRPREQYIPGTCGAVWAQETLFERIVHVCGRAPHDDNNHHDGSEGFHAGYERVYATMYTCNAVLKKGKSTWFCTDQLSHPGDHHDGDMTWPQQSFGDEDVPPIW
jgi:hypothetical protein